MKIVKMATVVGLLIVLALLTLWLPLGVLAEPEGRPMLQSCSDSYEPNESFGNAWYLSPGSIQSYICDGTDMDYYKFTLQTGDQLELRLEDLPANYNLCLDDPSQTNIACSNNSGTTMETITYTAATAGDYYARVYGDQGASDAANPYTFRVLVNCPLPLTDIAISGETGVMTNTVLTLTAVTTPANPSSPISYTWSPAPDSGQGTTQAKYMWNAPGNYNIVVTATNCGGSVVATQTVVVVTPTAQVRAWWRLKQSSTTTPEVRFDNGLPRFISMELPLPASAPDDPVERALYFLEEYKDLFLLSDPENQLRLDRRTGNGEEKNLFFTQVQDEIPVFASNLMISLAGDDVIAFNGVYLPEITVPSEPLSSTQDAEAMALDDLGDPDACTVGDTSLMYFNLNLVSSTRPKTYTDHLVWRVPLSCVDPWTYFVDAHTGEVVFRNSRHHQDFDLALYTAENNTSVICWFLFSRWRTELWYNEDGQVAGVTPDADGINAYNAITQTYNYFYYTHDRDSFDGRGSLIKLYVHRGSGWNNAHYVPSCDIFEFGDGYPTLDIVAHEYTHGVTRYTADLIYANQSGAMNESFSDIFGSMVDRDDWLHGEDRAGGASRDLAHPPNYSDPNHLDSPHYSMPAGCPGDPTEDNDFCGVHTNSGILNNVAYLMAEGGTHPFSGLIVDGIGRGKTERILYKALTERLSSNSDFEDAREQTLAAARHMPYRYAISERDLCSIRNAFAAVGVGWPDQDCDGIDDAMDPDYDDDGLENDEDNCTWTPNPWQGDMDDDGWGDACDNDIDGDGVYNYSDNCPRAINPGQADTDGDGDGDACDDDDRDWVMASEDNCPDDYNPHQTDTDGDGVGDACDSDSDADGRPDTTDNCPQTPNNAQTDTDGDGVGNACDNCDNDVNVDQRDIDDDGQGDVCDTDIDGDGVPNSEDNCDYFANPGQADLDGNGLGSACDMDERRWLVGDIRHELHGVLRFRDTLDLAIKIPIEPCLSCDSPLAENYQTSVDFALESLGLPARIVDDEGMVVASNYTNNPSKRLSFWPNPGYSPPDLGSGSIASLAATDMAQTPHYILEIFPTDEVITGQAYSITIQVNSELDQAIYLPVIMK